jgi:hypothetical protein
MSKETEIRYYNRAGNVVRPRSGDGLYVIRIIWHQPDGSLRRWSEKSGWLKADPASKTKFKTWAELWEWTDNVKKQAQ